MLQRYVSEERSVIPLSLPTSLVRRLTQLAIERGTNRSALNASHSLPGAPSRRASRRSSRTSRPLRVVTFRRTGSQDVPLSTSRIHWTNCPRPAHWCRASLRRASRPRCASRGRSMRSSHWTSCPLRRWPSWTRTSRPSAGTVGRCCCICRQCRS